MVAVRILDTLFEVYYWILILRFLSSWMPSMDFRHPIVRFLYRVTDPVVGIFQGLIPPVGNVDFSPVILFLVLRWVYPLFKNLLIQLLVSR